MEFQDVVSKRRMVRSFEPRPLPRDVVERIVRNAQRAPSAGFSQGSAFLVLDGSQQTRTYWDAVGPTDATAFRWQDLYTAPLLIVCLSNKHAYLDRYAQADKGWTDRSESHWPAPYWDIDTGFGVMMILLTAVELGLGALFFGIFQGEKALMDALGVPDGYRPIGAIAVGHPTAGERSRPELSTGRRRLNEVVRWERW